MGGYHVISPDLPGRTVWRQPCPPNSCSVVADVAASLVQMLRLLGAPGPLHLVASGFGAQIATTCQLQDPHLVASTITFSSETSSSSQSLQELLHLPSQVSRLERTSAFQQYLYAGIIALSALQKDEVEEHVESFTDAHVFQNMQMAWRESSKAMAQQSPFPAPWLDRATPSVMISDSPEAEPDSFAVRVLSVLNRFRDTGFQTHNTSMATSPKSKVTGPHL